MCQKKRERVRLQQEVESLQRNVQFRIGELQSANNRCSLLECKIQELLKSVGEWESKAETQKKKEKMERD